jgi:hypothetical protein
MLTIDQRIRDDGTIESVTLEVRAGDLFLQVGSETATSLPVEIVEAVMTRYGKPLAPDVRLEGESLEVGGGRVLRHLRHLARYDVIARDFLVWTAPGQEPVAELAVTVAAAIVHLAQVANVSQVSET